MAGTSLTTLPSGGSTCQPSIVRKVLRGARKLFPSADYHLVRCELALWQNPIWRRSSRRGTGGSRPRLAIAGSRHQVAESLSKLSLSGLRWKEASSEIYQTVRTVVGTTRQKAKYWVYNHREEVDQIVLERKAAGNTAHAKTVAKRKFAMLCDSWWDRRAQQLQCAADASDIKRFVAHAEKGYLLANAWVGQNYQDCKRHRGSLPGTFQGHPQPRPKC